MHTKSVGVGLLIVMLGFAATLAAAAQDETAPYLGKWAITLQNAGGTFNACWLNVVRKGDGGLDGQLLWRYGSVVPVKSVKVENGELQVVRPEYDDKTKKNVDCTYRMKVANGKMDGSVKYPDGKDYVFTGVPAIEKVDVAGTWNLGVLERQSRKERRTLKLQQDGDKITGTVEGDGLSVPISGAKLDGNNLSCRFEWGRAIHFTAQVAGDELSGKWGVLPVSGERQRKAGPTIALFNGKDLTGWHSRDPKDVPPKWDVVHPGTELYISPRRTGANDIVSDQKFDDFKLLVKYCLPEKGGNSGVYVRGRYEVQILDDFGRGLDPHGCGAVYSRVSPIKNVTQAVGTTQTMEITLLGRWITVVHNGVTIVDNQHIEGITGGALEAAEDGPGPIMLQAHGQAVRFLRADVTPLLK